jgi:hypothetical protein
MVPFGPTACVLFGGGVYPVQYFNDVWILEFLVLPPVPRAIPLHRSHAPSAGGFTATASSSSSELSSSSYAVNEDREYDSEKDEYHPSPRFWRISRPFYQTEDSLTSPFSLKKS